MSEVTNRANPASLAAFDEVIDVRTPAEFALDHVPGAVNLPVLSNDERARVGTIYVQDSRMKARRIGAALVARNIAAHLEGALKDKPGSYAPLIYCWRGGQRSLAMATVLEQVGWRPTRLAGGYMTYRRRVTATLYGETAPPNLVLLDGYTGSAKTEILHRLAALGVQVLDLEGLAGHRGSLFGAMAGQPQPGQKQFESALLAELERFDPRAPVVVEAESSKVGQINLPPVLWKAMAGAPRIEIVAPRAARVDYLIAAYRDLAEDAPAVAKALAGLTARHGRKQVGEWREQFACGELHALAYGLVERHYDPAYERGRREAARPVLGEVSMADLGPVQQEQAAKAIIRLVKEWRS
jgi:tRNA 2-selenouridine synthase